MTFYAPGIVTPDRIAVNILHNGTAVAGTNFVASTNWLLDTASLSTDGFEMISQVTSTLSVNWANAAAAYGDEGIFRYHYVADARLGK
jgi:hypothetical protein